ncbi:Z1 domain-containing protein [Halopseudomonas laoshanensis]|uniref:Z1 domain-containing protein n=1 Tax=Halopseudomonas laoshanensis TaxID=2268758 RepID=UPI003735B1EC
MSEDNKWSVIKFVQNLLADEEDKSAQAISEKIDVALMLKPAWALGLNRTEVSEELIRRFSEWVGDEASLVNSEGHIEWLTPEHKKSWRYWQRYREWQEQKLSWSAVESVDRTTDHILGMLEDPKREGAWDRRGMVVGHVQSGKTGSYTGLICKSADAGYKIIIVLAGLHNNLRSQTQMRLDEGFLGFETRPDQSKGLKLIGVGEIDRSADLRPQFGTNRTETGDFTAKFAKSFGVTPEERPWLFVVKKNKTVLTRLLTWIQKHVAQSIDPETGRPLVKHLPLLIIDDEADHASVDTGEKVVDENGNPDLEHEPKTINSLIRKILHSFTKKAYVGYTATPFANIYIHSHGETIKEGPDLFPAAFITNLSAPSSYIGPSKVFGLAGENGRIGSLDLVRTVNDHCSEDGKSGWMPVKHKTSHVPTSNNASNLPDSLVEAVHAFVLACAIRKLRGQGDQHSSMLIHVTRFNLVQAHVHQQVQSYISHLKQRIQRQQDYQSAISKLSDLFHTDFINTTNSVSNLVDGQDHENISWLSIEECLPDLLDEIKVKMINGTAGDILDYSDSVTGIKVIAIGGDKLARGLTLEGLCVSYFLRASKMYDTLMQMGRWFGYRPGYLDLCRLYTTEDLVEWFEHIADAAEELRSEFDFMTASGETPFRYGLKVRSHPVLMVTSPLKMRTAKTLYLSFSGDVTETITFFRNKRALQENYSAFHDLVAALGSAQHIPAQPRPEGRKDTWKGAQWSDVDAHHVINFLRNYKSHPDSTKVQSHLLADFVEEMQRSGELTSWTVAVVGGSAGCAQDVGGVSVDRMKRSCKSFLNDRYSIGRLLSPQDEGMDLDENSWRAALNETQSIWKPDPTRAQGRVMPQVPNGPAIRRIKGLGAPGIAARPDKGLLIISLLDPQAAQEKLSSESDLLFESGTPPIVAFAISFPSSNSGKTVPYLVTDTYWEQRYGASE